MALPFVASTLPGQAKYPALSPLLINPKHKHTLKFSVKNKSSRSCKAERRASAPVRATSEEAAAATSSSSSIFGEEQELSGLEKLLEGLSAPARYGTCAAIVAGALAAGYAVGSTRKAALGGALALGVAGGITAYALNSTASKIASVNVHNKVVNCGDPTSLSKEDIDSIVNKFGDKQGCSIAVLASFFTTCQCSSHRRETPNNSSGGCWDSLHRSSNLHSYVVPSVCTLLHLLCYAALMAIYKILQTVQVMVLLIRLLLVVSAVHLIASLELCVQWCLSWHSHCTLARYLMGLSYDSTLRIVIKHN